MGIERLAVGSDGSRRRFVQMVSQVGTYPELARGVGFAVYRTLVRERSLS